MTKSLSKLLLITLLITLCGNYITAQNRDIKTLRKQRKEIQILIELTSEQLRQTQRDERISLRKFNTLQKNLTEREKLINSYNIEIKTLQTKINLLTNQKKELEEKLNRVKKDYTKLIQSTQQSKNKYNKLMFILSAKNFNQTWRRIKYIQTIAINTEQQAKEIHQLTTGIQLKSDSLIAHKSIQEDAKKAKKAEIEKLRQARISEKKLLTNLQNKKNKLTDNVKAQQKKRNNIDNKIKQVIEEEIRKEAKRKKEIKKSKNQKQKTKQTTIPKKIKTNKEKQKQTKTYDTTPTDTKLLSKQFVKNKGRLPAPVRRGYISARFGRHTHPRFKHIKINNQGIFYQAPKGSNARAVFDGVVTRRFSLPGSGNAIIIQHGIYRTVYGNLTSIYVKEGDKVSTKQPIGRIYTDEKTGETELQFQLWYNSKLLNPEPWITK